MTILNIAEKPSVANSISKILSTNCRKSKGMNKYCSNIYFETDFRSKQSQMVFTSVLGHLMEVKFEKQDMNWKNSNPRTLFDTKILNIINPEHKNVAENIIKLAQKAELIIIWTDCDREGENIAQQIKNVINGNTINNKLEILRARFSAISRNEIQYALENLTDINYKEAVAVDARKELDLRIGSVFTRIQTISYDKGNVLSFGPCQIPTLNFVVQRHNEIENFIPEKFYSLENVVKSKDIKNIFKWKRSNIFDKNCVVHFFNELQFGEARITDKKINNKEKYRPLPLRTVEFQKTCSSYYKIDSHKIMEIAEKLYNNGYISYPRTETDSFPKNFNYKSIIDKLKNDDRLGEYSSNFKFKMPRSGNNNDQAHSPIYPLKAGSDLIGNERKIYEFVSRRFLGCVSENAKGIETEYQMKINMKSKKINLKTNISEDRYETFICKGLNIIERNYLDIYIYDKWESNEIGEFNINDIILNNLEIKEGTTTKPEYLTESDLITLMDKNGIGTDATIHEHIQKIQERNYVKKINYKFKPLSLGINLIKAYNTIELPISEPNLRKNLEENLKKICQGQLDKNELVENEIISYKQIYDKFVNCIDTFKDIMQTPHSNDNIELTNRTGKGNKPGGKDNNTAKRKSNDYEPETKKKRADNAKIYKENQENRQKESGKFTMQNYTKLTQENKESTENHTNKIKCGCNKEAKLLESKKEGNIGKLYYTCYFYPKKCTFFEWKNESVAVSTELICFCGYEPKLKTANTETNRGRDFFCCNKNYKKCKFFKWADEI